MVKYISAMAKYRKEIASELYSVSAEVMDTIIKLCLYPNHESTNHWKKEVYALIHTVPLVKGVHKFPSKRVIFNNTWGVWGDSIDKHIKVVIKEYGEPKCSASGDELISFVSNICIKYFDWLSGMLSVDGAVSKPEVMNKLDELITQ